MDLSYIELLTDKEVRIREHTQQANPYLKEFNLTYKLKGVTVNLEINYNGIRDKYTSLVIEVGKHCAGYHMSYTPFFKDAMKIILSKYPEIDGICKVFKEEMEMERKERKKSIAEILKKVA